MSKWPTIEELIKVPFELKHSDPIYHTQQFPIFMKRKSILKETYDKPKTEISFVKAKKGKKDKKHSISLNHPSQTSYRAYGRIFRYQTAKAPETSAKALEDYDQAIKNQTIFTNVSPNDAFFEGEYRHSTCPQNTTRPQFTIKNKSRHCNTSTNTPLKNSIVKDEGLADITKSNIKALLSDGFYKKCSDCGKNKCDCVILDKELPKTFYDNLNKGKDILQNVKKEKKNKRGRQTTPLKHKKKNLNLDDFMRYTYILPNIKKKIQREIPIITLNLNMKFRRYSS